MLEFKEWPKIKRLNRDIIITEKIDGTNACIIVGEDGEVGAQSRSRVLRVGESDNFGFLAWTIANADTLRKLGPGYHFGEWYGKGIGRNYALPSRRFALFNTTRWLTPGPDRDAFIEVQSLVEAVGVVPIIYQGEWQEHSDCSWGPTIALDMLLETGSLAVPGWMKPEGIVVYHTASNTMFKATCEKDEEWKGKRGANAEG